MSDFVDVDINELLTEEPEAVPDDADVKAFTDSDNEMMREFGTHESISWPEPIRRRHLR